MRKKEKHLCNRQNSCGSIDSLPGKGQDGTLPWRCAFGSDVGVRTGVDADFSGMNDE